MRSQKLFYKTRCLAFVLACGLLTTSLTSAEEGERDPARVRTTKSKHAPKMQSLRNQQQHGTITKQARRQAPQNPMDVAIEKALALGQQGNYAESSMRLFNLLAKENREEKKFQLKYVLGLMLFEMKLYQTAAFQFVDIVRNGNNKYVRKSLEKLSLAASYLNDDTVLNFALSKMTLDEFPKAHQDMLYYRIGEVLRRKGDFAQAAANFRKVSPRSNWFTRAKYNEGLAYSQLGQLDQALAAFNDLLETRPETKVTDTNRVAAQAGIARVYYQKQNWDAAIEIYRQIPRDTEMWHDSLFELSWAYLRSAQFRSVLSNLHSLHSPYYEDHYNPESVLLRAIVYLYICKYDEMEKTLDFFERTYRPVQRDIASLNTAALEPVGYFDEIARTQEQFSDLRRNRNKRSRFKIPFIISRAIIKEGDVKNTYIYVNKLYDERDKIKNLPPRWRQSPLGIQADRNLLGRINGAKEQGGKYVAAHLVRIGKDLDQLFEQHGFARYEMLKGRKETIKKEISAKGLAQTQVDDDSARDFYIQNGYEYWPFKGEYWLDEIGNYHYVGVQSCE